MVSRPLEPCRALTAPERRSDDEDDHGDVCSRRRHRSRSLWDQLGGRSSSRSREPECQGSRRYNEENRGRQRMREEDINISHSRNLSRSVEPGETRIRRQSA
jgi:hypothetical protein